MFEVAPIEWLQGFTSPLLAGLMEGITQLGYTSAYAITIVFLAFAVRLRPALAVLLVLILTGIAIEGLKNSFGFPRPEHVLQLQATPTDPPVQWDSGGFWNLPSPEARQAVRAMEGISYGFPSGHTAAAMAFCLAMAIFYRSRAFLIASCIWPLLMGLSRMYLARHFVADVLGGLVVGVAIALLARALIQWLTAPAEGRRISVRFSQLFGGAVGLALLIPFTSLLDPENVGRLVAWTAVFGALTVRGFPQESKGAWQKAGHFALAMIFFFLFRVLGDRGLKAVGWEEQGLPIALTMAVVFALSLASPIAAGYRLGWYRSI